MLARRIPPLLCLLFSAMALARIGEPFDQKTEVGRLTGSTSTPVIEALVQKAF